MKVIVRAPLLSLSGYGVHSRQVFKWFLSRGFDVYAQVVPWGICTYILDEEAEDGLIGQIMKRTVPSEEKCDLSVQVQLPDEWDITLGSNNIGITAGVETDICSSEWVSACSKMDLVVVPSTFTKQTFVRSGVPSGKIRVVPENHSYIMDEEEHSSVMKQKIKELPTDFNFVVFGQITGHTPDTDRKNTFFALKWLCEAFKDDKDVGIFLKTNMGRHTAIDRKNSSMLVSKLIKEVRTGEYPRMYLAHGMLDKKEISSIYSSENMRALIAPTRGEGWGLTIIDAAASGMPVVATGYSGHMDFMSSVKFVSLDHKLIQVPPGRIDGRVFVEGSRWADVDEKDFKRKVKKLRSSYDLPKKWALEGAQKIEENFSEAAVFKKYDLAFQEILRARQ